MEPKSITLAKFLDLSVVPYNTKYLVQLYQRPVRLMISPVWGTHLGGKGSISESREVTSDQETNERIRVPKERWIGSRNSKQN